MQSKDDVIEIDLQELVMLLLHWLWLLVLCGVVAGAIGFMVCKLTVTPWYESTTRVYILYRNSEQSVSYSEMQLSSTLAKNFAPMIKSRTVLEKVIEICGLNESFESLSGRVKVSPVNDTNLIAITVTDADPAMAQLLASEIRTEAAKHIVEVMDLQAANTETEANLPKGPAGPNARKWGMIGALLGAFACAAILVIQYLLDDSIKSAEDVEKYLGLSTLAMIPVAEQPDKRKKKKGHHEHVDSEMAKAVDEEAANMDLVVQELKTDREEE